MSLQVWETLKEAIAAYTGLSPAVFFTIAAVGLAFYYLLSSLFAVPRHNQRPRAVEEAVEPLPPPVQLGEITQEELKVYDGSDPLKPLLMAIKGQIYDVSQSRMFYGPGGPYALFAGKDASRALAKMSFEEQDLTGDVSGLGPFELEALQDWEYKFMSKYIKVGTVKKTVTVSDRTATEEPVEAADCNGATTSTEEAKHTEDVKPIEDAKHTEDVNLVEYATHAEEVKQVEDGTHAEEVKQVEDGTHAEEVKQVEDGTHTEEVKQVEDGRHSEDVKLVEAAQCETG